MRIKIKKTFQHLKTCIRKEKRRLKSKIILTTWGLCIRQRKQCFDCVLQDILSVSILIVNWTRIMKFTFSIPPLNILRTNL